MADKLTLFMQWLHLHPNFGGIATFIISAAESVAIIGTIVPGTVMMTAIGGLAGAGVLPLWTTILWAIAGAIVGDGISYWMGHRFKDRIRSLWPFRTHPQILASGESFVARHGGKSVFIGRFVGPVRALVPLVAGMLGMEPLRFTTANVISAIGWAPAYMFPGILLGAVSLELPPDIAVHAILFLLLSVCFIIFCVWSIAQLFMLVSTQIDQTLNLFWARLQRSRYLHIATTLLKHHNPHRTHGQLSLAFYLIVTCLLFTYLALQIFMFGPTSLDVNNAIFHLFRSIRSDSTDTVMLYFTLLGEKQVILPLIVTLFAWLAWKKHWRVAWHWLALGILAIGSTWFIKKLIHSPRPWGILQSINTYSFPSGHTTYATIFYTAIVLLMMHAMPAKRRWIMFTLVGMLIAAVSVSRMYLGAHWFSDIVGAWLLGAALIMFIVLSFNRQAATLPNPTGILVTTLLTLSITFGGFYFHHFKQLKYSYSVITWPRQTITMDSWWGYNGDSIPLYRTNRLGKPAQLLTIQWLGKLPEIQKILLQQGWKVPPKTDWISVLHRITNIEGEQHLPLVSPLYLDNEPALTLIKEPPDDKRLLVIWLWDSHVTIQENGATVWVGTVNLVPLPYSWLFTHKNDNGQVNMDPTALFLTSPLGLEFKEVSTTPSLLKRFKHFKGNQHLLLIRPQTI